MSLYDDFQYILKSDEKWNPTRIKSIDHDIHKLFTYPTSYNFLFEMIFGNPISRDLSALLNKYCTQSQENRINHTISLYLMGIMVGEKIGYEKFKLPLIYMNNRQNFLFFWSAMCLFHDFGYIIEKNNLDFPAEQYKDITNVIRKFNMQYNLCDFVETELIEKYYSYRINEYNVIDHGIVGGMLLFNYLLKEEMKKAKLLKTATICSEIILFGDKVKRIISIWAMNIARHNMWFANAENESLYKKYNLNALIPKENKSHRIIFSNEPMLFLLCLLDSIELLKKKEYEVAIDVLKENCMRVSVNNRMLEIILNGEIAEKYSSCIDWLNIAEKVKKSQHKIIRFEI